MNKQNNNRGAGAGSSGDVNSSGTYSGNAFGETKGTTAFGNNNNNEMKETAAKAKTKHQMNIEDYLNLLKMQQQLKEKEAAVAELDEKVDEKVQEVNINESSSGNNLKKNEMSIETILDDYLQRYNLQNEEKNIINAGISGISMYDNNNGQTDLGVTLNKDVDMNVNGGTRLNNHTNDLNNHNLNSVNSVDQLLIHNKQKDFNIRVDAEGNQVICSNLNDLNDINDIKLHLGKVKVNQNKNKLKSKLLHTKNYQQNDINRHKTNLNLNLNHTKVKDNKYDLMADKSRVEIITRNKKKRLETSIGSSPFSKYKYNNNNNNNNNNRNDLQNYNVTKIKDPKPQLSDLTKKLFQSMEDISDEDDSFDDDNNNNNNSRISIKLNNNKSVTATHTKNKKNSKKNEDGKLMTAISVSKDLFNSMDYSMDLYIKQNLAAEKLLSFNPTNMCELTETINLLKNHSRTIKDESLKVRISLAIMRLTNKLQVYCVKHNISQKDAMKGFTKE